jgi:hypothetical protein
MEITNAQSIANATAKSQLINPRNPQIELTIPDRMEMQNWSIMRARNLLTGSAITSEKTIPSGV